MIKGKTPEEIRKQFNIVNDFTPEEEAQVCQENKTLTACDPTQFTPDPTMSKKTDGVSATDPSADVKKATEHGYTTLYLAAKKGNRAGGNTTLVGS